MSPNPRMNADAWHIYKDKLAQKLQDVYLERIQDHFLMAEYMLYNDARDGSEGRFKGQRAEDLFIAKMTSNPQQWSDKTKAEEVGFFEDKFRNLTEWLMKIAVCQAEILAQAQHQERSIDLEKPTLLGFVMAMYDEMAKEIMLMPVPDVSKFAPTDNYIDNEIRKRFLLPIVRRAIDNALDSVVKIGKIIEEQLLQPAMAPVQAPVQAQQVQAQPQGQPQAQVQVQPANLFKVPSTPAPKTPKSVRPSAKVGATPKSVRVGTTPKSAKVGTTPKSVKVPATPRSSSNSATPAQSASVHTTPSSDRHPSSSATAPSASTPARTPKSSKKQKPGATPSSGTVFVNSATQVSAENAPF